MPVTNILSIEVDKEEYSRFEVENSTIRIQFFVVGDTDTITLELRKARRARNSVVATTTYAVTAASTPTTPHYAYIDLNTDTLSSPDLISLIRRGNYFVRASADDSIVATIVAINAPAITSSLTVATPALPFILPLSGEIEI